MGAKKVRSTPNINSLKLPETETTTKPQKLPKSKTLMVNLQKKTRKCRQPILSELQLVVHKPDWLNIGGQENQFPTNDSDVKLKSTDYVVSKNLLFHPVSCYMFIL